MDVIVNLGSAPGAETARGYVVGTMRSPVEVRSEGRVDVMGVRFRPGAAVAFLPVAAHEVTDARVPLADLWREGAAELVDRLAEADAGRRVGLLADAVLRRRRTTPHLSVRRACALLERERGRVSVREMAEFGGVTPRHLERLFSQAVGLSPREAGRTLRFRAAVGLLHARPALPLSRVALEAGYHDQAHLTREFRALAGTTPAAYRAGLHGVASIQDSEPSAA